jgi:sugar phosphate isomerase/epimerase
MKDLLRKYDITLVSAGVVTCNNEEDWRNLFDFARDMGIQTITSEPRAEDLDLVESLADEYEINVAFHNHPRPSIYWNPDSMIEALRGRSRRLGICADTGHWIRSGLNPTQCIERLGSRILTLHFKDLNEKSPEAHDVPWGTGVAEVISVLSELAYQGYSGYFMIEYEHNWENSLPEVKQCVDNFERMAAQAVGK